VSQMLKTRLQQDLNQARKDRDRDRVTLLSMTISEVRNREIELGREADEEEVSAVIVRAIKRRKESAELMRGGGRPELAEGEEREAVALSAYLPEQLTEAEVRALVREIVESGVTVIGPVMGELSKRIRGRFDGREANRIVRELLTP